MRSMLSQLAPRASAAALFISLTLVAGAAPGIAAPLKPGKVTGLVLAVTKPFANYRVASTWNRATNADSYRVKLVSSTGSVLDSQRVTDTSWTGFTSTGVGTRVKVVVTPYRGTRKGLSTSASTVLPDLTGPTGAYDVAYDDTVDTSATVTQTALADDVSAAANITREIDFGDGAGFEPFPVGDVARHIYATTDGRYVPVVRLTDEADNASTLNLSAVVIGDEEAPVGTYDVSTASAWAKLTHVSITQTSLSDAPFSPNEKILREILWGDDSPRATWSTGAVATHVYQAGGTFTPRVFLTDEAGNSSEIVVPTAVQVTVDSVKPVVKLRLPLRNLRSISKWTTLRGTAKDGTGTGVKVVRVRAVEKRGTTWYAYKPRLRTWVKAGATKSGAYTKAGLQSVKPTSTGGWSVRLYGLRKGRLAYRVVALDKVNNKSKLVTHAQLLTRA